MRNTAIIIRILQLTLDHLQSKIDLLLDRV
jgi:hypothetical protein